MVELTGPQLFLRYAFPCAEEKLHAGKINQNTFDDLAATVKNNGLPSNFSLGYCFSTAVKSLDKFSKQNNKEMWALETVAEFWRYHHGHTGDCAVRRLVVFGINGKVITLNLDRDGFTSWKRAINLYGISLRIGDSITTHRGVVIEKIEL